MKYIEWEQFIQDCTVIDALDASGDVVLVRINSIGEYAVQRTLHDTDLTTYNILSELQVPGTPKIICYTKSADHTIILEEYIKGQTLRDILDKYGPINKEQAFDYLVQLCDILIPLHKHSPAIIHRDIKPSNIILREDSKIFLIDFDAATYYLPEKDQDTTLLGTQGYAAPEQYGFNASNPRTDIYAIGKLGMELMTGESQDFATYKGPFNLILNRCTSMDQNRRYDDAQVLKKELLRNKSNASGYRLPGYRSGSTPIMVIATIAYLFIPFFTLINIFNMDLVLVLSGIGFTIASFLITMIAFNFRGYLNYLPLTNSRNGFIKLTSRIFYISMLLFILFILVAVFIELIEALA